MEYWNNYYFITMYNNLIFCRYRKCYLASFSSNLISTKSVFWLWFKLCLVHDHAKRTFRRRKCPLSLIMNKWCFYLRLPRLSSMSRMMLDCSVSQRPETETNNLINQPVVSLNMSLPTEQENPGSIPASDSVVFSSAELLHCRIIRPNGA